VPCGWFKSEPTKYFDVSAPWSFWWLAGMSSTLRLGLERRRQPCTGDVETPSFVGKLLSEKQDQGDRDCVHGRVLIARSNTLRECFNNVDVGVPL